MLVYSIEGAIGVGKSTFLTQLESYVNNHAEYHNKVLIVTEPVHEWMQGGQIDGGEEISPLQAFYDNPDENAAIFQVYVFVSRLMYLQKRILDFKDTYGVLPCVVFVERFGGLADEEVFVRVLCERGIIKIHQYEMYRRVISSLHEFNLHCDELIILYVSAPFNATRIRISNRDREAERNVDAGHLLRIFNRYEAWLGAGDYYNSVTRGLVQIVRVDNSRTLTDLTESVQSIFNSQIFRDYLVE